MMPPWAIMCMLILAFHVRIQATGNGHDKGEKHVLVKHRNLDGMAVQHQHIGHDVVGSTIRNGSGRSLLDRCPNRK